MQASLSANFRKCNAELKNHSRKPPSPSRLLLQPTVGTSFSSSQISMGDAETWFCTKYSDFHYILLFRHTSQNTAICGVWKASSNKCIATRNKCIATSNKCLTSSNKKFLFLKGVVQSNHRHGEAFLLSAHDMRWFLGGLPWVWLTSATARWSAEHARAWAPEWRLGEPWHPTSTKRNRL